MLYRKYDTVKRPSPYEERPFVLNYNTLNENRQIRCYPYFRLEVL